MSGEKAEAKKEEKAKPEHKLNDEIVQANLPMIQAIAASVAKSGKLPPGISYNDLISFGYEGFVKAFYNYDDSKNTQFHTYAAYRVRGEILDRLRKEWKYRNPVSYRSMQNKIQEKINDVVSESLENTGADDPRLDEKKKRAADLVANSAVIYLMSLDNEEIKNQLTGSRDVAEVTIEKIEFGRERKLLWEEVSTFSDLEKDFIHLFYEKEMTQKDIAEVLNLSKSKASRLHVKILDKLRNRLKRKIDGANS